jgi:hypothetical protein
MEVENEGGKAMEGPEVWHLCLEELRMCFN